MKKYAAVWMEGLCPECQQMRRLEKGTGLIERHGDDCGFMDGRRPVWLCRVRLTKAELADRNRKEMQRVLGGLNRWFAGL